MVNWLTYKIIVEEKQPNMGNVRLLRTIKEILPPYQMN